MSHYLDSIEGVSHQRGRHSATPASNEVLKTVLSPPSTITKRKVLKEIFCIIDGNIQNCSLLLSKSHIIWPILYLACRQHQAAFAKQIDGNIDKDDRDQATVPRSIQVKLHVLQLPQCHLHILVTIKQAKSLILILNMG